MRKASVFCSLLCKKTSVSQVKDKFIMETFPGAVWMEKANVGILQRWAWPASFEQYLSSAPRRQETHAGFYERLVWFHVEDEFDEMRGGEEMRAPQCLSVVQCPAGPTPLQYITGSWCRMWWIETDDNNRGKWVFFFFFGSSNQRSDFSTIVQSVVNCNWTPGKKNSSTYW